jgi:hypothetical protein
MLAPALPTRGVQEVFCSGQVDMQGARRECSAYAMYVYSSCSAESVSTPVV